MENNNKPQSINIFEIIRIFLSYWPVFLISLIICFAVALLYLRFASKTYSVFARVAINTERINTNRGSSEYVNVNDMMRQEKDYANEITFLRSSPLIREVVDEMNLFTTYYTKEDKIPKELPFSFYNIYKKSPFIVIPNNNHAQPLNTLFYIKILDDEKLHINSFSSSAISYNIDNETKGEYTFPFYLDGEFKFGEQISTEDCSFKILLNSNYNKDQYLGKDLFFRFNSPQDLAYSFQKSLEIGSAFFESSIADLSFESNNLELAKDFLTILINKYIEKNLEKKNYNANNTLDYINNQLANISGTLGQSERQLQLYRSREDVMNIDDKTRNIYGQRQNLEDSRDLLNTQLQNLLRLKQYFEENKNASTFIAPTFLGMSDATLATLIEELTNLSRERQNLISTNQLKNPRIKTLDANISTIKNVISDNISFNLTAVQNELDELNIKLKDLEAEFAQLPQTQRQLLGLEREFNINDAVYTTLLNRRIQAQIAMASSRPDIEILEPVQYSEISSPSPKLIVVIALFLGVLFPSIYIIIVNFLTQKIRTKSDLTKLCHLPVIGAIPHNDKKIDNVIFNTPQSPIAERFHAIRTNLIYYLLGEKNKCILVTSTLPNEGKSFTSLNLALSFSSTHYKTVLIGFDLRKTTKVFKDLNPQAEHGLSSYLIKHSSLKDIICKTEYENLDFISSGQIPPDPFALLTTKRTEELFTELKANYDYIIIDTPPYGLVSDAFHLMKFSDINLYVSRLGIVIKKAIKQTMEELKSKEITNIYSVQNDITKIDKSYTQKYYYEDRQKGGISRLFKKR